MREYGEHLARSPVGPAHLCVTGYEAELAGLPGAYVSPGALLLGLVDGGAAGCVALKPIGATAAEPGALELKRLWVQEAFRGVGLGRRLMQAAIEHARAVGAGAIYLDTVPAAMPEANRLYAAMGFRQAERYNDNQLPDVVFLRLQLTGGGAG
jgi:hypothetical protein